jgi:hypothetical protein
MVTTTMMPGKTRYESVKAMKFDRPTKDKINSQQAFPSVCRTFPNELLKETLPRHHGGLTKTIDMNIIITLCVCIHTQYDSFHDEKNRTPSGLDTLIIG